MPFPLTAGDRVTASISDPLSGGVVTMALVNHTEGVTFQFAYRTLIDRTRVIVVAGGGQPPSKRFPGTCLEIAARITFSNIAITDTTDTHGHQGGLTAP